MTFGSGVFIETPLHAQAPPASLQATYYYNITATSLLDGSGYIDNRSQFTRQNNFHSFYATGTGTWSVTLEYADGTPTGWTSFGSNAVVSQSTTAIGYGIGYHDFIKFAFSGTATVTNYSASRNFWFPYTAANIAFPITIGQGGTGATTLAGAQVNLGIESTPNGYNFTPQFPGGTLVIGSNTINITGIMGLNGTDSNHWLYVSGGTGAAEPCLVTGGSATSGVSGNIVMTCAANHSGAWTISSTAGGIPEAIQAVLTAGGGTVLLQPGVTYTLYAAVRVPSVVILRGQGGASLKVADQVWPSSVTSSSPWFCSTGGGSGGTLNFPCAISTTSGASYAQFYNFTLDMNGANQTNVTGFNSGLVLWNSSNSVVSNVSAKNMKQLGQMFHAAGFTGTNNLFDGLKMYGECGTNGGCSGGVLVQISGTTVQNSYIDGQQGDEAFVANGQNLSTQIATDVYFINDECVMAAGGNPCFHAENSSRTFFIGAKVHGLAPPATGPAISILPVGGSNMTDIHIQDCSIAADSTGAPIIGISISGFMGLTVNDVEVSGCTINGVSNGGIGHGISIASGVTNVDIHDNQLNNNTGYAIAVTPGVSGINIHDNHAFGNGVSDFACTFPSCLFQGNVSDSTYNNLTIMPQLNAGIYLGGPTNNVPQVNFKSSGSGSAAPDYDCRLSGTGGDGTNAHGLFQMFCSGVYLNGVPLTITTITDLQGAATALGGANGGELALVPGTYNIGAGSTFNLPAGVSLKCLGHDYPCVLSCAMNAGYACVTTNGANTIEGIKFATAATAPAGHIYMNVVGNAVHLHDNQIDGAYFNGITVGSLGGSILAVDFEADSVSLSNTNTTNLAGSGGIDLDYAGSAYLDHITMTGPSALHTDIQPAYSLRISNGDTIVVSNSNLTGHGRCLIDTPSMGSLFAVDFSNVLCDSAWNVPRLTSSTSVSIGTGSKAFTVLAEQGYTNGYTVWIYSAANPANWMRGTVTSYSGTTLTVNVATTGGSGTFTDWQLSAPSEGSLVMIPAGPVNYFHVTNLWSSISDGNGCFIVPSGSGTIYDLHLTNVTLSRNLGNGCQISGAVTSWGIHKGVVAGNGGAGISLQGTGISKFQIDGLNVGTDPTAGVNVGVGIAIIGGSNADYGIITGNTVLAAENTGTIMNFGSGTHNIIVNNPGYNPVGGSTGTVGTSPWTYTNGTSPATFYVKTNGANISAMTVGGTAIATTTPAISLAPNEALVITWATGAPTYAVDVQ